MATQRANHSNQPLGITSSSKWCQYFIANQAALMDVPWELGAELTDDEKKDISTSVQAFQLGESSEAKHLFKRARAYVERTGDTEYLEALRLFIMEEHRHARQLGQFLTVNSIPLIKKTFADSVFRKLRHLADMEVSIAVLIIAEIIAKVYYAALQQATGSRILHRLCEQILQDEERHVQFQSERLAIMRAGRGGIGLAVGELLLRILFFGTCFVVWLDHGRAIRAGGYGFTLFWRASWQEFNNAALRMNPRTYRVISGMGVPMPARQ